MRKTIVAAAVAVAAMASVPAGAVDIHFDNITRGEFRTVSKEAGAAIAFRKAAPADALGVTGFDAGVEMSAIDIDSKAWNNAVRGTDAPGMLYLPRLRARKGLPFGINVGAEYSYLPNSNIKAFGFEASKALLEGGVAMPALEVRASYTRLAGVSDLSLQTAGLDATLSKGFAILTPYAGAGGVWIDSKLKDSVAQTLGFSEKIWQPRVFGGVQLTPFPLLRVLAEVEYSTRPIYTLKAAVGF